MNQKGLAPIIIIIIVLIVGAFGVSVYQSTHKSTPSNDSSKVSSSTKATVSSPTPSPTLNSKKITPTPKPSIKSTSAPTPSATNASSNNSSNNSSSNPTSTPTATPTSNPSPAKPTVSITKGPYTESGGLNYNCFDVYATQANYYQLNALYHFDSDPDSTLQLQNSGANSYSGTVCDNGNHHSFTVKSYTVDTNTYSDPLTVNF